MLVTWRFSHEPQNLPLAGREVIDRASGTRPIHHPLDHLWVEGRAAGGHPPHGVREHDQVSDTILQEISDALGSVAQEFEGVTVLEVLGED